MNELRPQCSDVNKLLLFKLIDFTIEIQFYSCERQG